MWKSMCFSFPNSHKMIPNICLIFGKPYFPFLNFCLFILFIFFMTSSSELVKNCNVTGACDDTVDFEYDTDISCYNQEGICNGSSVPEACDWHSKNCECFPGSLWDKTQKQCVIRASYSCTNEPDSIQFCTPHSICNTQNVCECVFPYYEDPQGRCVLRHGFICSASEDTCDSSKFMECNRNTLTCDCINSHNSTYYHQESDTCKILADSPCNLNMGQLCTDRAVCLPTEIFQTRSYEQRAYTCKCKSPSIPNNEGRCFYPYQERCDTIADFCDTYGFLKCSNITQTCDCRPSLYPLEYSEKLSSCVYKFGEPCFHSRKGPFCPEGSSCQRGFPISPSSIEGTGNCVCSEGYEKLGGEPNSPCVKSYGMQCDSSPECNVNKHLECRSGKCQCNSNLLTPINDLNTNKIVCVLNYNETCSLNSPLCNYQADFMCSVEDERCRCAFPNVQFYSQFDQRCFSRLGTKCHLNQTEFGLRCQNNAKCVATIDNNAGMYGICRCLPEFTEHFTNSSCTPPSSSSPNPGKLSKYNLLLSTLLLFIYSKI